MNNKNTIVSFFVEAKRITEKAENQKFFQRYIRVSINYESQLIAYRIYGVKIIENRGLPLIKVGFADFSKYVLMGHLEQLACICLNLDNEDMIERTILLDNKMFDFMILQQ